MPHIRMHSMEMVKHTGTGKLPIGISRMQLTNPEYFVFQQFLTKIKYIVEHFYYFLKILT